MDFRFHVGTSNYWILPNIFVLMVSLNSRIDYKFKHRHLDYDHEFARVIACETVDIKYIIFEALNQSKHLSTFNLSTLEKCKFIKFSFRQNFLSYGSVCVHLRSLLGL